jgi:tetratricopeptide (TPR) repeat protein
MIPYLRPLALFIAVLAPGLVRADSPPVPAGSTIGRGMYEDIEIMRHILDRKLHALYPRQVDPNRVWVELGAWPHGPASTAIDWAFPITQNNGPWTYPSLAGTYLQPYNNSNWLVYPQPFHRSHLVHEAGPAFEVEGVYLKGQGVVYTVTLSSLQPAGKVETAKPVSEWESVRRQLHDEKEEPKKTEANNPPSLSEVLMKVLAENGHHFSQLSENESLTFVITVHDTAPSAPKSGEGSANAKPQTPAAEEKDASVSSKVRDLELLGDLHTKQEHYGMARDAFREALELKPGRKKRVTLSRKLAQAYLKLDKIEEARAALDQALSLAKEEPDAKAKSAPAASPAVPLPVKLIISAPKKLLDQVKEGKMSFEEFRRQASVETLKFDGKRR